MADLTEAQLAENRAVVAAAIAVAGVTGDLALELIPRIATKLNPGSPEMRLAAQMQEARFFTGHYRGYTVEESSQRLIVKFINKQDEEEEIRTERLYMPTGPAMKALLDQLEAGQYVGMWKGYDEIQSGPQAGRRARLLLHIQPEHERKKDENVEQSALSPAGAAPPAPSEVDPPASEGASPAQQLKAVVDLAGWTDSRKDFFKHWAKTRNLWPPNENNIQALLTEATKPEDEEF